MPDRKTETQTCTISELAREFDVTQRADTIQVPPPRNATKTTSLFRLSHYRGSR